MKFGIFGDPHITKKIQEFQTQWDKLVVEAFVDMYKTFDNNNVDVVVCTGDFFDKAVLEAKHVKLVSEVIDIMASKKTYLLLGNHEIDSEEHNILSAYDGLIETIIPVTTLSDLSGALFIPYNVDLSSLDSNMFKNRIIFTHHDIYGSVLAGGKVKASFGYDPNMFNDAKIVFNGHIHLRSTLGKVKNVGSLFSTQFGELSEDGSDTPMYYIYDTETSNLSCFINHKSLFYVTCSINDIDKVVNETYKDLNLILRVSYEEGSVEDFTVPDNVLKVSKRKIISNNTLSSTEIVKNSTAIDIKEMISSYIDKDVSVPGADKSRLKDRCFSILGG